MGVPLVCKCGYRTEASAEFLALHGLRCAQCQRRMMPQAWAEGRVRKRAAVEAGPAGEEEDLLDGLDSDLLSALDIGLREQARRGDQQGSLAAGLARAAVRSHETGQSDRLAVQRQAEARTRRMVGIGLVAIGGAMSGILAIVATGVAYGPVALLVLFVGVGAAVAGGRMLSGSR